MSSRIEQIIDEIETYIDTCKPQPLSQTKIIVNKEEIDDLLRELRSRTPEEIKRYQKIISNKEAILNDAKQKAQALIDEATVHTNELISEHEIMQQAYAQANEVVSQAANQAKEILDRANREANYYKEGAIQYTDQLLAKVEDIIIQSIDATNRQNDEMIASIKQSSQNIIAAVTQNSDNMVKSITQCNDNILSALTKEVEEIRSNRAALQPLTDMDSTSTADLGSADADSLNLDMLN